MNRNKNNDIFTDMRLYLNEDKGHKLKDYMTENTVFEEPEQIPPTSDEDFDGIDNIEQPLPDGQKIGQVQPQQSPIDAEVKPLVDKIRVLALQGIAKLANNPGSETYDMLKRIWNMVDKTIEPKKEKSIN